MPPFSHAHKSWISMFTVLWWEWEVWSQEYLKNEKEKMVFPYYHDVIEIPVPSRWEHKTWTDLFICDAQICASSRWIWHCLLNAPWPSQLYSHMLRQNLFLLGRLSPLLSSAYFPFMTELSQSWYCFWTLSEHITALEFQILLSLHMHQNKLNNMLGLLPSETWCFSH